MSQTIGDIGSTIGETGNSSQTSLAFITDLSDFLGRLFLVIVEFLFTADYLFTCMFFFWEIPRIEELDNKRSSARRGEFDSSTPEAIGVSLGHMFLARRFRVVEQLKPSPIKNWE